MATVAKTRMRSRFVAFVAPCRDERPSLRHAGEPALVQALVAQRAVKALNLGMLHPAMLYRPDVTVVPVYRKDEIHILVGQS